ncbi:MAG: hypothetical protein AAF316_00940 [Cyanobacteria bacterium P01_A01_bin.80]
MSKITRYKPSQITRFTGSSDGLKPEPVFPAWTNFVSQTSVRAIAMSTKSSCLWLATWGGVISWKWKENQPYQRYSSEHGIAGNQVTCICLDEYERPWIGHGEGGLSYFDGERWQVYSYLQTEAIRAVSSAGTRTGIYAATQEKLYYIGGSKWQPRLIPAMPDNDDSTADILALLADEEELLIGNPWGLFRASIDETEQISPEEIQFCTALAKNSDGRIWIGTQEGLYYLENDEVKSWAEEISDRVLGLAICDKRPWVLTTNGLFQITDNSCLQVQKQPEELTNIRAIAASTSDTFLWVGTDKLLAGVQMSNSEDESWSLNFLNSHPEDNLSNNGHCVLSQPNSGSVWVGTATGLFTYKPNQKWELPIENQNIRAIAPSPDDSKTLWVLSWPDGISKLKSNVYLGPCDSQLFSPPLLLAIGQDGFPYILTERALWRLKKDNYEKKEKCQGIPPRSRVLAQTTDGAWWLGTEGGLYRLIGSKWQFVGEQSGPLMAAIYALAVVENILWVATANGLWKLQENKWVQLDLELPPVWALAPSLSSEALWLACADGIFSYNISNQCISKPYTCINSGLASHRVTALLETARTLWIITQAGISRVTLNS